MTTPDTLGIAPPDYRLPATISLGGVVLQVSDLERSRAWYQRVLGLHELARTERTVQLGAHEGASPLVELRPGATGTLASNRSRLGLFHFAVLLPDRPSLGTLIRHLGEAGAPFGASDHLVSEALYLRDPDGLGIEVYADRPRSHWKSDGRQLLMDTIPLDLEAVVASAGDARWNGMPRDAVMGHMHLHVGTIERAEQFYHAALGLDKVVWSYPGALFLSAGGYHHHLGVNTWAGPSAVPATTEEPRLVEWCLALPTPGDVERASASLRDAGFAPQPEGADVVVRDPWGTALRITTRP